MQRPGQKRQIIKTRPQRPYVIARVVILLIVLAAIIAVVIALQHRHQRPAGASFYRPEVAAVLLQ